MSDRPNVLWICTDQQRFDTIHCLGNAHINTPNLDRLADEGMAFTRAYSQSPVCTPSRAAFLTGRYPRTTRCRQNGQKMPADEVLVTRLLADEGYDCGLAGKLHLAPCEPKVCDYEERIDDGYRVFHWSHHPNPDWERNAYTEWLTERGQRWEDLYHPIQGHFQTWPGVPAEYHQTTWCAEKAAEFITQDRAGPWLFSLNCFDPHHPFDPPAEYMDRYDPDAVPLPIYMPGELDNKPTFQQIDHRGAYGGNGPTPQDMTDRERGELVAAYYAMVELIDDQVGRLLDLLDETGQRENTIVIFHSDHGEMLGDHGILLKGPYFYEGAVRVPLIVSWPERFCGGTRSEALVELVDLAPTLLEACGLPVPDRMQGRSLLDVCAGRADPCYHRNSVYCEYYNAMPCHGQEATATMYFDGRYKLVVFHGTNQGEMYDLHSDPHEFHNLWGDAEYKDVQAELMKCCFDASVFTTDPAPPRIGRW